MKIEVGKYYTFEAERDHDEVVEKYIMHVLNYKEDAMFFGWKTITLYTHLENRIEYRDQSDSWMYSENVRESTQEEIYLLDFTKKSVDIKSFSDNLIENFDSKN